jgi:hypothetical protein
VRLSWRWASAVAALGVIIVVVGGMLLT